MPEDSATPGQIVVSLEAADSADAQYCLAQYYAELARRFDSGFDAGKGTPPDAASMTPPFGCFALARLDGKPVGCGALTTIGEGIGEVKRLWVSPEARGRRLGSLLMDRLEAEAGAIGFGLLRLDTNRALSEARRMYLARGYREIAPYNDNPYADFWFEKPLGG